ncbi:MAG TPA: protein-disulfide reductase DsbD domain-containing protein [Candidatus Acidoferrales bacterium]|nr:protein-disulfide reductase DsbD domain-containing protein [Candidatus Acidoferrales bacterium]
MDGMMRMRGPWISCLLWTTIFAVSLSLLGSQSHASPQSAMVSAASIVKPHVYVSLQPVPRGKEFQVAIVAEIARGYHVNSHKPTDAYLIPTTVTPQLPAGFQLLDTIYPDGKLETFAFSPDKPLDVYSASVTLRLRLAAQADAALGPVTIPLTLRYQACSESTCLPPVKVPVNVKLDVADANATARPLHPEIFMK